MRNVVILGGNGALGSSVVERLKKNSSISLTIVVRDKALFTEKTIFWDYRSCIPEQLKKADVVINCARSDDFAFNVAFNRNLLRSLPCRVKLINISSNAVFAQPNGLFSRILFKGDAYIREKKLIEKYSSNRSNTSILRPTVVIDEGGWKTFFSLCRFADQVVAPAGGQESRIKITRREHVARTIENCIFGNQNVPSELFESIEAVNAVTGCEMVYSKSSLNYFDSAIKNVLLIFLSSWVLPDRLAFMLQNAILSRSAQANSNVKFSTLRIDGMTRLYLFGGHTK